MKQWKRPQISMLGIENTFDPDKTHYCHKSEAGCEIDGNHGNTNGHGPQHNWHSVHKDGVNPHPGYDHCCCYES